MGGFEQFALIPEQGATPQIGQLDAQMQENIRRLAARLNVRDAAAVMGFGAKVQKELNTFSSIALEQMLSKDIEPLDGMMKALGEQIRACSFGKEAKGLLRRMFGAANSLEDVRAQYERAIPRIDACADDMTDRRVALMRDSALLDRLYERNEGLYKELCSLIVIGEEVVRQAKENGEQREIIERMERRVQDIKLTQAASTQLAAQIRMIQAADRMTCEKLHSALTVTIPLWKNQMAAALGVARAAESMAAQRRVREEAQRGVRSGAREMRTQAKAFGKEAAQADREQAQATADALLKELEQIEFSLAEQKKLRQKP
ncbi:MAG: toxic anion resistance protein [Clostridia bacterium]|nr:toxic anion resistance protein [Clostridia bacterium]